MNKSPLGGVTAAFTRPPSKQKWHWRRCAKARLWLSCARSLSCTLSRSMTGNANCSSAPAKCLVAPLCQSPSSWPRYTPKSANWHWRMII